MAIYSYIVTHDTGFAPNPFWGFCTLACCKPRIRRSARVGDLIVGLSPKAHGNRLLYAMEVREILSFSQYFHARRFHRKRPCFDGQDIRRKCGDNIYEPRDGGAYRQLRSMHSNGEDENPATAAHDLSGRNVLVSDRFWYFGGNAIELPPKLREMITGRGHRRFESPHFAVQLVHFLNATNPGIHGPPHRWPDNDSTWTERKSCASS